MSTSLDVSVVMVSYNVADLLRGCLTSIQQSLQDVRAEVWVVDNSSEDGSQELVKREFPWVHLIASEVNLWFAGGNNAALPSCTGRYVLLLNPDTLLTPGALKTLVAYLDHNPTVGAAGPMIRLGDGSIQVECARNLPRLCNLLPWLFQLDKLSAKLLQKAAHRLEEGLGTIRLGWNPLDRLNLLSWNRDSTCEVECLSGACMLVRRRVVEQIGLMDESCPLYLDDIDYCQRIRQAGWSLHYVAEATIFHYWQRSTSKLDRGGDLYGMTCHANWLFLRKHRSSRQAAIFAAAALAASAIRVAVSQLAAAVSRKDHRQFWHRQLVMASAMGHWARSRRKTPPDLTA